MSTPPDKNVHIIINNNNKNNTDVSTTSNDLDNNNVITVTDVKGPKGPGPRPDEGQPPAIKRNPDIDLLMEHWNNKVGYEITAKVKANRYAASNLIKKHGLEAARRLVDGVAAAQEDRYAPRIGDFCELQSKLNQLIAWGKTRHNSARIEVIS